MSALRLCETFASLREICLAKVHSLPPVGTPPFVDGQIAAIAVVNDLVIVTANVGDYEPFAGLTVESWCG